MADKLTGIVQDNEVVFDASCKLVCKLFSVKQLKTYQEECIKVLMQQEDCFLCQPTGSGKSIVFQSLPFFKYAFDLYETSILDVNKHPDEQDIKLVIESCPYKVIVISPLASLMKDQENQLKKKGMKVCCLKLNKKNEEVEVSDIADCTKDSNIIFTSPEAILTVYRELLKNVKFGKTLLAFAIDESHCVKKWGSSSDQANVFRSNYSELSELRSLVFAKVPLVALTATATKDTKMFIIENLGMLDPTILSTAPERPNIKYCKINIPQKEDHAELFLQPIIGELKAKSYEMDKLLVFCRTMANVSGIYNILEREFKEKYKTYDVRPYAKFHSKTEEVLKDYIISEYSRPKGKIRFLVSTIAFGMGVNCRELYTVIHYGPPASLDDYFQEAGRAGRDGLPSTALMVYYPKCLNSKNICKTVKDYSKNNTVCRRQMILTEFGNLKSQVTPKHLCCDICEKDCECLSDDCKRDQWWNKINLPIEEHKKKSNLHPDQQSFLKSQLLKLRANVLTCKGHCGKNILSGFPLESIDEVIAIATPAITEYELKEHTCIFNENIRIDVVSEVKHFFSTETPTYVEQPEDSLFDLFSNDSGGSSESEGSSESGSNSLLDFHVNLKIASDSD